MTTPVVSVIIPCYNQGEWIEECIESVLSQSFRDFEIIVINDGSTDKKTIQILNGLKYPKTKIIHQENMGLAEARNTGIKNSHGTYVLPLDADDKLHPNFLEKTILLMEKDTKLGIVCGETEFFGAQEGYIKIPYKFPEILYFNMLQCTCLFRKSDWEKVGGYNPNMKYGMEDWDLWLSFIELGLEAYRIPEPLFYYRKKEVSMITELVGIRNQKMREQLYKNHIGLYAKYPNEKNKLFRIMTIQDKIRKRVIKILCLFIPVKSWRHKLREFYKKGIYQ